VRKDLRDADDQIKAIFVDSAEALIAAQFPVKKGESEGEKKKRLWVIDEANRLRGKPEVLLPLKEACDVQAHPMKKFMQLREALKGIRETLVLAAGTGVDLGTDEFHPFMACGVIQARPNSLCSVAVFLHDFCLPNRFPCEVFGNYFQSVCPIIWHVCQEIAKVRLDPFFALK
jgi:hypothetical protein